MARIFSGFGFHEIVATPHLIPGVYNNTGAVVRKAVRDLTAEIGEAGLSLKIWAGAEYYLDEFFLGSLDNPLPLPGQYILIEAPPQVHADFLLNSVYQTVRRGFTPLLAHPERSELIMGTTASKRSEAGWWKSICLRFRLAERRAFRSGDHEQGTGSLIHKLRNMGCLFQGNIGSFAGFYGEAVRKAAIRNLEAGGYDRLGTDAHTALHLEKMLDHGLKEVERIAGKGFTAGLLQGFMEKESVTA